MGLGSSPTHAPPLFFSVLLDRDRDGGQRCVSIAGEALGFDSLCSAVALFSNKKLYSV